MQIRLFMQNKSNLRKRQTSVSDFITMDYGKMDTWSSGKNEPQTNPIQTQTNPISGAKNV
jgi:hypothetical protein